MSESYYEDLVENQGFSEEQIAIERAEVELLLEPGYVWPENETAAQVFVSCAWEKSFLAGATKVIELYHGVPSREVIAVCLAHRIPRSSWADVLACVQVMVSAARPILNRPDGD
jgi:hypothetical protein